MIDPAVKATVKDADRAIRQMNLLTWRPMLAAVIREDEPEMRK
jgi:hypothetical protein